MSAIMSYLSCTTGHVTPGSGELSTIATMHLWLHRNCRSSCAGSITADIMTLSSRRACSSWQVFYDLRFYEWCMCIIVILCCAALRSRAIPGRPLVDNRLDRKLMQVLPDNATFCGQIRADAFTKSARQSWSRVPVCPSTFVPVPWSFV